MSRRGFLGAGAASVALGAVAVSGLELLGAPAGAARSGLLAAQLAASATLRFDRGRTRPGHPLTLSVEVPAAGRGRHTVRAWLFHERPGLGEHARLRTALGAPVEVVLEAGRGRAELVAPMAELDADERAREGFLLTAALIADDDPHAVVLGAPVEVVVSPFVLGL